MPVFLRKGTTVLGAALLCLALVAGPARAAIGPSIFEIGHYGSGAGQLATNGGGIATDPTTGHLFVSEKLNNRISEFTAWGEFVKAWGWGVEDGSPELQTCGPVLPTLEPALSLCVAGTSGAKAGQMQQPNGIALGPNGNIYVFELFNRRVQVFSQAGAFLRTFGGEVNKTTTADICTAASGNVCGAGIEGTGPSEFSIDASSRITAHDYIDIAADGTVYVGDKNRIQKFDENGNFLGALDFTGNGQPGQLPRPSSPGALALDPASGDIYFSSSWIFDAADSYRLDENTGAVIYPLPATAPEALATAPAGTVFLNDDPDPDHNSNAENNPHLLELNDLGGIVESCCPSTSETGESILLPAATTNIVTNGGEADLYVAHSRVLKEIDFIDVRGPVPSKFLPPPSVPPGIVSQAAISVGEEEATLRAQINPNFWADTSYHLEYGTAPCPTGCTSTPDKPLGAGIVRKTIKGEPVEISGLEPDTIYHYRFVAVSGGGGPVVGPDRTFTTSKPDGIVPPCANDAFRPGAGARLADCRAYEMVSPIDKSGGDILVQGNINSMPARLDQAHPSGEEITYSSYRSFGDAESAPYTSQYLASRGAESWSSKGVSPPISPPPLFSTGLDSQYEGFSEDLSSGWFYYDYSPPLAPGAIAGHPNFYRRDIGTGAFETLSTAAPIGSLGEGGLQFELQGTSADGTRTFFRANAKLTASAAPHGVYQTYEAFNGIVRLVSVKPEGSATTTDSSVGSLGGNLTREGNSATAVSDDGKRIYWSEKGDAGRIYVRVNTVNTVAVSAGTASFWAARPDGSQAIYSEGGVLKRFTLSPPSSETLIPSGVQGLLGASEDLTRIYAVSSSALDGAAVAGKPNLYFYEEGQPLKFVATLSGGDMASTAEPAVATLSSLNHVSRVSDDGAVTVFMSRAALTGADNVDQESGEADAEVFRYDAASDELLCVSCVSTGAAPVGRELQIRRGRLTDYWYASRIPTWEFQLHAPRVIAAGGNRVYFNSLNALARADTNELEDVYQWEAPGSGGTCIDQTSPGFNEDAGGCVTLISSGSDERDSEFVDASADGRDVFLLTGESLVGWDPGQIDLYDARSEGGLPAPPPVRGPECEGEACQPQGPAAPSSTPNVSESYMGPGNPKPPKTCKKGYVKKKGKCVKKKGKANKHAHKNGRAGR